MALGEIGKSDDYIDWRGREIQSTTRYGGIKCAVICCVVEIIENLVFISNASNFVKYFVESMHFAPAEAVNNVTNFMATAFLLTLLGGFVSDSFIPRSHTFVVFGLIELSGLIILAVQASHESLLPAAGHKASGPQQALLYAGLYMMAAGFGGVKASLEAHGADQLDGCNKQLISSYFNWFFFCLTAGGLLSSTFMVWIEENRGWVTAFRINVGNFTVVLCLFASMFSLYRNKRPAGSPFTRISKVILSAVRNRKSSSASIVNNESRSDGRPSRKFKFLDKAAANDAVSWEQVEETRTFLGLLPIFASTIMMNCCLAQLSTYSILQATKMNRKLGSKFVMPAASLNAIPTTAILVSILMYERIAAVFVKKDSNKQKTFAPIRRVGLGLLLASVAMAAAAAVEAKRRNAASHGAQLSALWLAWQFLILGLSDMLTLGGMLDFFYSEAPASMRSMSTAFAWCSTSLGYFLSSVIVSIVNAASRSSGHPWLAGKDVNGNRLDLFYTLLCVLNFVNFLNYLYWAKRY